MAKTRILLTGANSLTGSHILAQLLSHDAVSVRGVVESREAARLLQQQYQRTPPASLDFAVVSGQELMVPGILDEALHDFSEPFHAVIHTLIATPSDEAGCLSRFINLETGTVISLLKSIQEVAQAVKRVVIVTSLTPF